MTDQNDPNRLVTPHVCEHGTFNVRATPFVNKDALTDRAGRWKHLPLRETFGEDFALNDLVTTEWRPDMVCACHIEFMTSRQSGGDVVLGTRIINRCVQHADIDDPNELFKTLQQACLSLIHI